MSARALIMTLGLALAACGSQDSEPEADLGGLLHSRDQAPAAVDVDKAQREISELVRALARPHSLVRKDIGAHRVKTVAKTEVRRGQELKEGFTTTTSLAFAENGHFSLLAHNDKTYGRDVLFDGSRLFLRPRYGKYHVRAPENPEEPDAVINRMASTAHAHLNLVAADAAIRTTKERMVGGRAAVEITLEKAESPGQRSDQSTSQRKWRENAKTEQLEGVIALDKETGVLLAAKLRANVSFLQDGQSYTMVLELDHQVSDVGAAIAVEFPAADMQLSAPKTSTELDERESLLEGIAPPARRGKTPKNPTGDAKATDGTK